MKNIRYPHFLLLLFTLLTLPQIVFADRAFPDKEALGGALYFDVNLSLQRNQSCASCHSPARGFIDNRENDLSRAVSIGSDGHSIGDRNTPMATYASLIPPFSRNSQGEYVGGQFHDGRANSLADQAKGPPLNPGEMAMPNKEKVLERLLENPLYVASFKQLFKQNVLNDASSAYEAMAASIASFERTPIFTPFDSKYDRYLKGTYKMSAQEQLGETLFFSSQFSNCHSCHQLKKIPGSAGETFSNYQYHNIGIPKNIRVRAANGLGEDYIDRGLLDNPLVNDISQMGKFKVPSLRNVAITGPYMHNGVFQDLKTVVLFYDKYNSRKQSRKINPETNKLWQAPEVKQNISFDLLKGKALTDKRVDALVAFLKTLTDKRYEHFEKGS
ncbi:MAG: c-type cytochrome [Pseudomonadales bacterium]|nr:c-type cytochrome [Pseudomonadales bacterium]